MGNEKQSEGQRRRMLRRYDSYLKLEKSLSENTYQAYRFDLAKLLEFADGEGIDVLDMSLDDLHRFAACLHDIGIQPSTRARIICGVRSFFHYLVLEDYRTDDPSELLEGPKLGVHYPEVLTVEEIDRIIGAIDLSQPTGHRNRAIVETLYSCGLRVSELCGLRLSCLYLSEGFIKVEGKGSKQRLVPISPRAIRELQLWFTDRNSTTWPIKPGQEDFVFLSQRGKAISRVMVFHIVKQLAAAADITKTISPHTFRHSFATHLLEGGANLRAIQAMMGHESLATTEIYTHIDRQMIRSELKEHHPFYSE